MGAADDFQFGPFVFDRGRGALLRAGKPVAVGQRGLALLAALGASDGPVAKAALLEAAWPGMVVEEGNLTVQIAALRKALGRQPDGQEWIVTVPRVGYRLIRADLPGWGGEPRLPAIAVLPFQNVGGDPKEEYFADGIVDELITALSRFQSFTVISRSSSFARKGHVGDIRQIAGELGVRYVLEGSVRRDDNRLRLVAQLTDGGDGASLWAQRFEGRLTDVFEFQDRITASVAALVEPQIQRAELERSRRERPESLAAYDLYLRAMAKIYEYSVETNSEAIGLLERAIAIEPANGVYLGTLAFALEHRISMSWPAYGPNDRARCLECAHEAVERASRNASILARCALAMQLAGEEYEAGLQVARQAAELNPNDSVVLLNSAIAELVGGDLDRSLALSFRSLEIQPDDAHATLNAIGNVYLAKGHYAEALEWSTRAMTLNRRYVPTHWSMVAGYVKLGRMEEARRAVAELLKVAPGLTVEKFASSSRTLDRSRDEMMVEALRQAGLPER